MRVAEGSPPPERRPALYFDEGRTSRDGRPQHVQFIVIHWMVGTLASTDNWFNDADSYVSAHYGIGEGLAYQWVDDDDTAWHAGDYLTNTQSIGIEHSAAPGRDPDEWTYHRSIELCAELCTRYGLVPREAIIRHRDVLHDGSPVATLCPGPTADSPQMVDVERIISGVEQRRATDDIVSELARVGRSCPVPPDLDDIVDAVPSVLTAAERTEVAGLATRALCGS